MKARVIFNLLVMIMLVGMAFGTEASVTAYDITESESRTPSGNGAYAQPTGLCGGEFPVVGDASVDTNNPSPYGSAPMLPIYKGEDTREVRPLLRFNLAGDVPSEVGMFRAYLELPISESRAPYPYQVDVYHLQSDFDENTVTWSNQPALGEKYASLRSTLDSDVLRIDVTALVIQWLQGTLPQAVALVPGSHIDMAFNSKESPNPPRLYIDCVSLEAPIPVDYSQRDQKQAQAILRLQEESTIAVTLKLGLGGSVRFAHFDLRIPDEAGQERLEHAQWFLDEYRDLFRLDQPRVEMQLVRWSEDNQSLFFRQRVDGIPVFPSETVLHMHEDSITGISGGYVPDINRSVNPLFPAEVAEQLALEAAGDGNVLGVTQLSFVNLGLLGFDDDKTYLAWRVNAAGAEVPGMYYIDAETGKVLLYLPHAIHGYDLELSTGNHEGPNWVWPCWDNWFITADDQWYDENGEHSDWPDPPPNPDADGQAAFNHFREVYDYFNDTFGRDSFDSKGAQIRGYVHVNFPSPNAAYDPACDIFEFGDDQVANDTMAHEFTHAVTNKTANLIYQNQSGALNESFSDIFGYFVDDNDWTFGEDDLGGPIRSLQDPTLYSQPDRMSDYRSTQSDFGGVHTNSGILNKAAYLIIHGDTFNGRTVTGIGKEKAQRLFYGVLTSWLTKNALLFDARDAAVWAAYGYYHHGLYGYTVNDVCQVRNAFAAVELGQGDRDCDLIEDWSDLDNDNDGWPDSLDNCKYVANGSQDNIDNDSLGNACDNDMDADGRDNAQDNCPLVANPGWADSNGNGIGDACEDSDGDLFIDAKDNCIAVYNPDQHNQDKDNLGDACDPDLDDDGKNNTLDNCPIIKNVDQANGDGDPYGDACDLCPQTASNNNQDTDGDGLGNPCDADDDGDGKLDNVDNCPLVYNPEQLDTDHNDIGHACDSNERNGIVDGSAKNGQLNFPGVNYPWSISIPVCNGCASEYLPQGFAETIKIDAGGAGVRGRIVDSEGMPMATSASAPGGLLELTFYPHPHAAMPGISVQRDLLSSLETFTTDPDQIAYRLELYPLEGTELGFTYPITLQISTVSYYVFLPVVMR